MTTLDQPLTDHERILAMAAAYPDAKSDLTWADIANVLDALSSIPEQGVGKFKPGDRVQKKSGSEWHGRVCGAYSTELTPEGYCVESERERNSVQNYPVAALEAAPPQPAAVGGPAYEVAAAPAYTTTEKAALLALAYRKIDDTENGAGFTSAHAATVLDLLERFTRQFYPAAVAVTDEMVETLATELARATLAEALPDRETVPMSLVEPIIGKYRVVARTALEAALEHPMMYTRISLLRRFGFFFW